MDIITKKREALDHFIEKMLKSEVKNSIATIYLFGSVAKGDPKEGSDVDLLIFGINKLDKIREWCAELQMETYFARQESIEALIYPIEDFRRQNSYFLYRAINYGQEVYSMEERELKSKEISNLLQLASEYLDGAKSALDSHHYRIAIDAAYNGAELCTKGLLLLELEELPTSHGGIVGEFGRVYVKGGDISKKLGRQLNRALETRNKARYDFNTDVSKEKAQDLIELAEQMSSILNSKLDN